MNQINDFLVHLQPCYLGSFIWKILCKYVPYLTFNVNQISVRYLGIKFAPKYFAIVFSQFQGHTVGFNIYIKSLLVVNNTYHSHVRLIIYYKNAKTKNLVMQNNIAAKRSGLQRTNVLYEFTCLKEDCRLLQNMKYIGETTTSLSRRLTMHLQNGAIRKHFIEKHQEPLTRSILESNTKILTEIRDHNRLAITEAIIIKERNPLINIQDTGICRTLKLYN